MKKEPESIEKDLTEEKKKAPTDNVREMYFWAQALTIALAVLVLINTFFFRLSGVHGSSMCDTLANGDQLILQIIGYDQPRRGDIIVCTSDGFGGEALVKRVIAVAGDVVDIDADGNVVVNGETLYEPYIREPILPGKRGDQQYPLTVREGCLFVMGDNRNGSTDSRFTMVGQISEERVLGKVLFRFWPLTKIGVLRHGTGSEDPADLAG